jgi:hypothetical protein
MQHFSDTNFKNNKHYLQCSRLVNLQETGSNIQKAISAAQFFGFPQHLHKYIYRHILLYLKQSYPNNRPWGPIGL